LKDLKKTKRELKDIAKDVYHYLCCLCGIENRANRDYLERNCKGLGTFELLELVDQES